MSEEVRIRPMAAADVGAVMDLAAGLKTAPHWPRAVYETALDAEAAPARIALVAEREGAETGLAMAGFVMASVVPPQSELETIAVSPEHQNQGVGSALLAALCRALKGRGISEMTLEVRVSNARAIAFYGAHGFAALARREGYYADTGEAAVVMRAFIPGFGKST